MMQAEPLTQALAILMLTIMMVLFVAPGILVSLSAGMFAVLLAIAARIAGPARLDGVLRVIEAVARQQIGVEREGEIRSCEDP